MQPPIIEEIIHLESNGKADGAMDRLLYYIDSLHCEGLFEESDDILVNTDITLISTDAILTMVLASYHAKDYLPYREEFINKVKAEFHKRNEDVEALFKNLE